MRDGFQADRLCTPGAPRPKDVIHKLPDTDKSFTEYAIHYDYGPADWHLDDHPPMPRSSRRDGRATSSAHAASATIQTVRGKPENAPVAGLPAAYILQQLQAFRNGTRRSADPRKANTNEMIQIARHLTEAEMKEVATYFSSIKWRPWVRVVETDMVPKSKPGMNGLFLPQPGNEMEPLGKRILEVPENPDFTERRAPLARECWRTCLLAASSAARKSRRRAAERLACTLCHGPELQGMGPVPMIVDRQASYISRQRIDYQAGTRQSATMKPVVAKLNEDDIIALAAYLGSK